ncbi:YopX family protein [Lentilactobacillus sp. IMAU92037]|uniref:YopX family protein n=1 Tax=Lentilactobacillus dabitei TaxID=2831523 RepID=UPI001C2BA96E|nr:YopX family protein [Lentilactobacillus dabitei]MBV0931347.1 YopX family protein [Lentilactobacillus dabitei]
MSRETKFRSWNSVTKEMEQVIQINLKNHYVQTTFNKIGYSYGQPDDVIVEQYTGLKDANGKEIYEGDVVHGYDQEPDRDDGYIGSSVIEVVNFKWGSFWLGDFKNRIMLYTPPIIEVIGNVHENPELLEAQHE